MDKKKVFYVPGRFNPPHRGHIEFFKWLLEMGDIIIGIGSCYEVGSPRHPILAFMREKMIRWSLAAQGVDMRRVSFVHLQDFQDWEKWWSHINGIPRIEEVTHLVTGNEEILRWIEKRKIESGYSILNPEKDLPDAREYGFRATDLRQAIVNGEYRKFTQIAADGTIALMGSVGGFRAVFSALEDTTMRFVPGRQTVDMIVTCGIPGEYEVLCGRRGRPEKDFYGWFGLPGGGIDTYENPMDAAVRETFEETGVTVEFVNRLLEPGHVIVHGSIAEIGYVGLFGSKDPKLSGTLGGSSQVFHVHVPKRRSDLDWPVASKSDLVDVGFRPVTDVFDRGLAYQQSAMLEKALSML